MTDEKKRESLTPDQIQEMITPKGMNPWPHFPLLYARPGKLQTIGEVVKDNWKAGVTIALISMPLSAALGIASVGKTCQTYGDDSEPTCVSPALLGIVTSIWSGLVMAVFGSSDINIVGCSGALSGMMTSNTVTWGPGVIPWLALCSACWLAVFTVLGLHKYLFHMPNAVFEGFSIAVAIIIGLNQLNYGFGLQPTEKHSHFYENVWESLKILDEAKGPQTAFFLINTAVLCFLLYHPKTKAYPWIPISAFVGVFWGYMFDPDCGHIHGTFAEIRTLKTNEGFLEAKFIYPIKNFDDVIPEEDRATFVVKSLLICIVGALETVLSAKVAKFRLGDWPFVEQQEIAAESLSQFVTFAAGVMPNTGLFLRTNVNCQLQATHRMSNFIHVVVLFIIVLLLAKPFSYLPEPSAAAILATGSLRMVPYTYLARLWREDKWRLALLAVVTLISVFEDPAVGLLVGIVIGFFQDATKTVQGKAIATASAIFPGTETGHKKAVKVTINGPISYITGESIQNAIKEHRGCETLVINCESVGEVDFDGIVQMERACDYMRNDKCSVANKIGPATKNIRWTGLTSKVKDVIAATGKGLLTGAGENWQEPVPLPTGMFVTDLWESDRESGLWTESGGFTKPVQVHAGSSVPRAQSTDEYGNSVIVEVPAGDQWSQETPEQQYNETDEYGNVVAVEAYGAGDDECGTPR